jgi:small basic protein (TIGR04137 family)
MRDPLVGLGACFYHEQEVIHAHRKETAHKETPMSIDKSLRRKNTLQRARNVLTRGERIKTLMDEERWKDDRSPYGLPKVKVIKLVVKKAKKAKEEEKVEGEGEAAAAEKK